jgi:hypothetical protein
VQAAIKDLNVPLSKLKEMGSLVRSVKVHAIKP